MTPTEARWRLHAAAMTLIALVSAFGMFMATHKASVLSAENARLKRTGWETALSVDDAMTSFDDACFKRDLGSHWW